MKRCGIYLIKIDEYNYVGQSHNIVARVSEHKRRLENKKCHNSKMQSVYNINKSFTYEILWEGDKAFLTIMEQCFINKFNNILNVKEAKAPTEITKQRITSSLKSSEKAKLARQVLHSQPKSEAQIEASRKNALAMSSPEATAKMLNTRKTSTAFKEGCQRGAIARTGRDQSNELRYKGVDSSQADQTIYVFVYKKTKEIFVGTRYEFAVYIKSSSKQLSGLIHRTDVSYHKWQLLSSPYPPKEGSKWSELLGSLAEGDQQPSLSSDAFEGSTTNTYLLEQKMK